MAYCRNKCPCIARCKVKKRRSVTFATRLQPTSGIALPWPTNKGFSNGQPLFGALCKQIQPYLYSRIKFNLTVSTFWTITLINYFMGLLYRVSLSFAGRQIDPMKPISIRDLHKTPGKKNPASVKYRGQASPSKLRNATTNSPEVRHSHLGLIRVRLIISITQLNSFHQTLLHARDATPPPQVIPEQAAPTLQSNSSSLLEIPSDKPEQNELSVIAEDDESADKTRVSMSNVNVSVHENVPAEEILSPPEENAIEVALIPSHKEGMYFILFSMTAHRLLLLLQLKIQRRPSQKQANLSPILLICQKVRDKPRVSSLGLKISRHLYLKYRHGIHVQS